MSLNYVFLEPVKIPEGKNIINKSGLWVIHNKMQTINFYSSNKHDIYDIKDLNLSENDEIQTVDFLDKKKLIIYSIKDKNPVCFFKTIGEIDDCYKEFSDFFPKTLSLDLNSIDFHQNILTVFTPHKNKFCVVSKRGLSYYDSNLKTLYSSMMDVSFCLVQKQYAAIFQNDCKLIKFNEDGTVDEILIIKKMKAPRPISLLENNNILYLFRHTEKHCKFYKIVDNAMTKYMTRKSQFNYEYASCFDNGIIGININEKTNIFFDLEENTMTNIGKESKLEDNVIIGTFGDRCEYALCKGFFAKLEIDFSNITLNDDNNYNIIKAIYRRKDGLNDALRLSKDVFLDKKLEPNKSNFINIINQVISQDPIAQLRFNATNIIGSFQSANS